MATVRELITKIAFQLDSTGIRQANSAIQKFRQNVRDASNSTSVLANGAGVISERVSSSIKRASSSFSKMSGMVGRAVRDVNGLRNAAQRLNQQKATVRVNADTKNAESRLSHLRQTLQNINSNRVNIESNIGSNIMGVASAYGGYLGASEIKSTADEMMSLDGRLRSVTKSEKERLAVEAELYAMGQRTRQDMSSLGSLYFAIARSSEEIGNTMKDNLEVTQTVAKSLIIGGASQAETSSVILQLGQALGSGTLNGDELHSLDENAVSLMRHVAKYFGTNVAGLKELGKQGMLTSDKVIEAIKASSKAIDKEFEDMPITFGQAMTVMENSWKRFILGIESKSNVFTTIAKGMSKGFEEASGSLHDFLTLMGTPDPNKKVQITEAATGKTKEISETDYYNQKAAQNPELMETINTLKTIGKWIDELDGKSGNMDEQISKWVQTFLKIAAVIVPIAAIIGALSGLLAILNPVISLFGSIGTIIQGAFTPILGLLKPIVGSGLAPILLILGLIALAIRFVKENWETTVKIFEPGLKMMKWGLDALQQAWSNLQPFIKAIWPLLEYIATLIGGVIVGAIGALFLLASTVFTAIAKFVQGVTWALGEMGEFIQWCADLLSGLIGKAKEALEWLGLIENKSMGLNTVAVDNIIAKNTRLGQMASGNTNTVNQENSFTFNVSSPAQAQSYQEGALSGLMPTFGRER